MFQYQLGNLFREVNVLRVLEQIKANVFRLEKSVIEHLHESSGTSRPLIRRIQAMPARDRRAANRRAYEKRVGKRKAEVVALDEGAETAEAVQAVALDDAAGTAESAPAETQEPTSALHTTAN